MPRLRSLIKTICSSITLPFKITKKMYRDAAVLTVGTAVVAVVTFASSDFNGGGRSAALAYVGNETETSTLDEGVSTDLLEEDLTISESTDTALFAGDSIKTGQLIVGDTITNELMSQIENEISMSEKAIQVQEEIDEIRAVREAEEAKQALMEARREAIGADSFTDEDYHNLLKIVEAEAGINGLEGKMIVANVILNRVKSSRFPNTISEVIFSPGQFSPVRNGRFYSIEVTDETVEAVERALNGEDNSRGALFFMNRSASDSGAVRWFDSSLTYLFSHGDHEYFK